MSDKFKLIDGGGTPADTDAKATRSILDEIGFIALDKAFIEEHGFDEEDFADISERVLSEDFDSIEHGFQIAFSSLCFDALEDFIRENEIFDVECLAPLFDFEYEKNWIQEHLNGTNVFSNPEYVEDAYFLEKVFPFFLLAFKSGLKNGLDLGKAREAMQNIVVFISFFNIVNRHLRVHLESNHVLKSIFESLPQIFKDRLDEEMSAAEALDSVDPEEDMRRQRQLTHERVAGELEGADPLIISKVAEERADRFSNMMEVMESVETSHRSEAYKMLISGTYKEVANKMLGVIAVV